MAETEEESSNLKQRETWRVGVAAVCFEPDKMADLTRESSNHLFETLSDWNIQLSNCVLYENPASSFDEENISALSDNKELSDGQAPALKQRGASYGKHNKSFKPKL